MLCGGAAALVQTGFEVLTEAGYAPEIAYFECLHELKLIVDLMYEGGIARMRYSVSDTAEYGDYVPRPARDRRPGQGRRCSKILAEIQSGEFTRELIADDEAGGPDFSKCRAEGAAHPIEVDRQEAARHDELGGPADHRDRLISIGSANGRVRSRRTGCPGAPAVSRTHRMRPGCDTRHCCRSRDPTHPARRYRWQPSGREQPINIER